MTTVTSEPARRQHLRRALAIAIAALLPVTLGLGPAVNRAAAVGSATFNAALDYDGTFDSAGNKTSASCPLSADAGPHDAVVCTADAPHVINQQDVNSGRVDNIATVSGSGSSVGTVVSQPASASIATFRSATIRVDKSAQVTDVDKDGLTDLGDTIAYSLTVTNTGNVTLQNISVTDPSLGTVTCPSGPVAPNAAVGCTSTAHTITQADVDAGQVVNTASATASPPTGVAPPNATSNTVTTTVHRDPELSITKTATVTDVNKNGVTDLGDTIDYTFSVRNSGNVTLNQLSVSDPTAGPVNCPAGPLAPNTQAVTCTAANAYRIAQSDVDAGQVVNTATTTATPPTGLAAPTATSNTVTTKVHRDPSIDLTKDATLHDTNNNLVGDAGETISYTFTVRNTGNVTLDPISVNDPLAGHVTCQSTSLAPNTSTPCTADNAYTILQSDVDAGKVHNSATATGTPPAGSLTPPATTVSATATKDVFTQQVAQAAFTKSAALNDANQNGRADAGETIAYTFTVTNTGSVTLNALSVDDPNAGGPVSCLITNGLKPKTSTTCSAHPDYVVTQADVDAGSVDNTATLSATSTAGALSPEPTAQTSVVTYQFDDLSVAVGASITDVNGDGLDDAGDTITYSYVVTNTGTTTLTDPTVTAGSGPVSCPPGTIKPRAWVTCTASSPPYVVTAADEQSGSVTESASAAASGIAAPTVTSAVASLTTRLTTPAAKITLDKQALLDDLDGNSKADVGETIAYQFVVTNAGNVALTKVGVSDAKAGKVSCPSTTLAPKATETCKAVHDYTVTATDVDAPNIVNTATASGVDPAGATVDAVDSVATPTHRDIVVGTPGAGPDTGSQQPGGLAWTGAPVLTLLALAAAGLALGVLFLLAGLRRHREEQ